MLDLANLIDRTAQQNKMEIGKLGSELSQIRQELNRLASTASQGGSGGMGMSLERAGYNLSVSLTSFAEKLKLAFLWGCGILAFGTAAILALLLTILLEGNF